MIMQTKIHDYHTDKIAYIYLRQSTMGQVVHHQESTERQYALTKRARDLGWEEEKIKVLDQDLGFSGTEMHNRQDFKTLVADVSMNKVGAVFALEVSRLSRSNTDWYRLLELCALTDTLIIDADGCYDPKEFNDQLLLGLKGTMSQAEIHFLRSRLQGGKLNKAQKGELKIPLPVGFCYDRKGKIILDRSKEVQRAIHRLFSLFRQTGSAYGVVQKFRQENRKFPKRQYGGKLAGQLTWSHLYYARVLGVLQNPIYTGMYVYGRYQYTKELSADGQVKKKKKRLPVGHWKVHIKRHHAGYITWKEYLENRELLARNRTNEEGMLLNGPTRNGRALLQGLLLCKKCGRKLTVRYKGNGGKYASYECLWRKKDGLSNEVVLIQADLIDEVISKRILEIFRPFHIKIALQSLENFEKRNNLLEKEWRKKITQAEEETQFLQKRYEETDPSNKLVLSTLESQWNDALVGLEQIRRDYKKYQERKIIDVTKEQKKHLLSLIDRVPEFWENTEKKPRERKRLLRLLIKDITVEKNMEDKKIILYIRWQGGVSEKINVPIPPKIYDRVRYSSEILDQIRDWAGQFSDEQIARKFNRRGQRSAKGKSFKPSMIRWIRRRYNIVPLERLPDEWTVKEVCQKFHVRDHVVYYWMKKGYVQRRKVRQKARYWIKIDTQKEQELLKRVKAAPKK